MKKIAVILAAGKGTRMKSELAKVLHKVDNRPMANLVIDSVLEANIDEIVVIVGHQEEKVKEALSRPQVQFVTQKEQLGTGHAVMMTKEILQKNNNASIVVLAGDCPMIKAETINSLFNEHINKKASATILTTKMKNPASYGRIIRDDSKKIIAITEAKDCTDEELKVNEINSGIYVFNSKELQESLEKINNKNKQNEYYLTDVISILKNDKKLIAGLCIDDSDEVIGINSVEELENVNKIIGNRNKERLRV